MKLKLITKINDESRDFIKRVYDHLKESNQLDKIDDAALNMLAVNYSLFLDANKAISEKGLTSKGSRGNDIPNPAIKIANDAEVQCIKLMEKFGLTPRDRQKMKMLDSEDELSPLETFVKESKELR